MGRPSAGVDGARVHEQRPTHLMKSWIRIFRPAWPIIGSRGHHREDHPLLIRTIANPNPTPPVQLSINGRLTIVAAFKYVVHSLPAPSIQNPANHGQCTSSILPQECCRQSKQCLCHFDPGRRGGFGPSLHRPCVHLVPAVAS